MKWTLLGDPLPEVRAVVFTAERGTRVTFTPQQPRFAWDSPGAAPLAKIDTVAAGQGEEDDAARAALAETLLRNVYRGFDYRSESDIYDALAQSVAGDLLTDLYLKIKQGLTCRNRAGRWPASGSQNHQVGTGRRQARGRLRRTCHLAGLRHRRTLGARPHAGSTSTRPSWASRRRTAHGESSP